MSDFISRQDVLDVLRNLAFDHIFQCGEYYGEDERQLTIINARKGIDVIEAMPSAEPEQKKGKWIVHDYALGRERYECAECKGRCDLEYDFCPSCGADMRGEYE